MMTLSSAVRRGVHRRATRAHEHMADKYEKRGEIIEFEPGESCTIKVPKKDRPSGATTIRTLTRVLRRRGHVRASDQAWYPPVEILGSKPQPHRPMYN